MKEQSFTERYMQHEKLKDVAQDFREKDWPGVLRFLLQEAGVTLCDHGYLETDTVNCPRCSAELNEFTEQL
jgi:hypothetical protein